MKSGEDGQSAGQSSAGAVKKHSLDGPGGGPPYQSLNLYTTFWQRLVSQILYLCSKHVHNTQPQNCCPAWQTVHAALKKKVNKSPLVIVLTDKSADITTTNALLYTSTNTETFQPSNHFDQMIHSSKECVNTTGAGIAKLHPRSDFRAGCPINKID